MTVVVLADIVTYRGRIAGGSTFDSMPNYRGTAMPDTNETRYVAPAVIATEALEGMLEACPSGYVCPPK